MVTRALLAFGMAAFLASPIPAEDAVPAANPNQPPPHTLPFPNLGTGESYEEALASFALGPQMQRGLSAAQILEQRERLDTALAKLQPQRPGTVDAYVLTIALDSDPVFAREAREAGRVLARRYDGAGRTLTLAGPDGHRNELPHGSIDALIISLATIAALMDREEDVLVVYTTSHGLDLGLAYHYGDTGYGILSPERFGAVLEELGIERRLLILSACYSGVFIPALASADTAILTAAAGNRTSFGCEAENDWTFFGDALINRALRQPQGLSDASRSAHRFVAGWEAERGLLASLPQTVIGDNVEQWLAALEARMPTSATEPVGRPAAE
ncbi:C13 family peptidase [Erythrobacter sp. JK5]|uniref:C13 family peptidase n=1 Tax=Erythrobacter sp. JK5 TaxID=2829500 RepID=UPI001BA68948|nr:C13 family peptidase [Erythrobacter sp. JK5]QUL38548.1 peptidase C13 [Erythrobacter sp. JK5]